MSTCIISLIEINDVLFVPFVWHKVPSSSPSRSWTHSARALPKPDFRHTLVILLIQVPWRLVWLSSHSSWLWICNACIRDIEVCVSLKYGRMKIFLLFLQYSVCLCLLVFISCWKQMRAINFFYLIRCFLISFWK